MWFDSYNYVLSKYKPSEWVEYTKLIRRGILLDTAPLYILIVGHYDELKNTTYVERLMAKDNSTYKKHDYKYLLAFLNSFGLGEYSLYVTQQVFTEFIKHLWEAVHNPRHFAEILELSFKTKKYIKEHTIACVNCFLEKKFLEKELEIGDISITIVANSNENPFCCVLTDDKKFAIISDTKYNFLSIYYNDIRNATIQSGPKDIPPKLLVEPVLS